MCGKRNSKISTIYPEDPAHEERQLLMELLGTTTSSHAAITVIFKTRLETARIQKPVTGDTTVTLTCGRLQKVVVLLEVSKAEDDSEIPDQVRAVTA